MIAPAAIEAILIGDATRWRILDCVRTLSLPHCWIGAGFVRNAVWDHLHGRPASPPEGDVDVIWFDATRADAALDVQIEADLCRQHPGITWSVKNQARMHLRNNDAAYASCADAMRHWPETATAVAARRTQDDRCEICAPLGLDDLLALKLRPTAAFAHEKLALFQERVASKGWLARWPQLSLAQN